MDLPSSTMFFVILSFFFCYAESRKFSSVITVSNGAKWGNWGPREFCPKGHANGFAVKILEEQGVLNDDTGMEGIRLRCTDGSVIQSSAGPQGTWSDFVTCPKGNLISFILKVEPHRGLLDDTAVNKIQFKCENKHVLESSGTEWGSYGEWSNTCFMSAICGIQTKVEPIQDPDNTGLNDVKFFCCD